MSDDTNYRRQAPPLDKRYPPRNPVPPPEPGQDFDTLTRSHGRPRGYFERDQPPKRKEASREEL